MLGGWAPLVPADVLSEPLTLHCQGRALGGRCLDQGPELNSSCEPKGGRSPGIPQLDKSAGCSGVKSGRAITLCVWGWLLPSACVSSRQGQAHSLSLLPTPSLPSAWHGENCQGATSAPRWDTLASSAQPKGPHS